MNIQLFVGSYYLAYPNKSCLGYTLSFITSCPTPSSPISLYCGSSSSGFRRFAMAALLAAAA